MEVNVVYVAAFFPKLSETFVYREVLGLRERGLSVPVVSVRPCLEDMGTDELNALKDEVIPVYGRGWLALVRDSLLELLSHPMRALKTLGTSTWEMLSADDMHGIRKRLKVGMQGFASLALAHRLRPLKPDLLHAHMAHVPTTITRYTALQLGIPYSFTGHAADIFRDRTLLASKLKEAAFVNCISEWHRSFYQSLAPRPDADYPVLRCGVDPSSFPERQPTEGPLQLFAVGRLVKKKGFDLLLDALATASLAQLDWKLLLIGDGPERELLDQKVAEHPCRDRISMPGAQPNHKVREAMSQADIFILPCRVDPDGDRDGIPVVLMEAMAAGAAVISGDVPSIRELVLDGVTGRMVPSEDIPALCAALEELMVDDTLRQERVVAGRGRIDEEFSLSITVDRMLENLKKLAPVES